MYYFVILRKKNPQVFLRVEKEFNLNTIMKSPCAHKSDQRL